MPTTNSMAAGKRGLRLFATFLFLLYLAALIYGLFFCEALGRMDRNTFRYNLVPFLEIKRDIELAKKMGWSIFTVNLLGNVIGFIPFGYFLPCVMGANQMPHKSFFVRIFQWTGGVFHMTAITFFFSLAIETGQLLYGVGVFDVDDLILNTAGGVIGYLLYRRSRSRYRKRHRE